METITATHRDRQKNWEERPHPTFASRFLTPNKPMEQSPNRAAIPKPLHKSPLKKYHEK